MQIADAQQFICYQIVPLNKASALFKGFISSDKTYH